MTNNEKKAFKKILYVTRPMGLNVFCKVRMIDVVTPKKSRKYSFYRGKVIAKHFDFVITDDNCDVVLVIELDDSSHKSKDAKKRDNIKNVILKDVGIPLLRTYNIDEDELRHILKRLV